MLAVEAEQVLSVTQRSRYLPAIGSALDLPSMVSRLISWSARKLPLATDRFWRRLLLFCRRYAMSATQRKRKRPIAVNQNAVSAAGDPPGSGSSLISVL